MGGQERVALDLARGQIARGHRVHAISLAPLPDGPLASEFLRAGAEITTITKGPGVDAALVLRLAWYFRRAGIDVVHTHNPQPLIYAAPAAKLARARAVHTKHGANPATRRVRLLRGFSARFCDAYVAVSETTAETARAEQEIALEKLHTIANGIALDRFAPSAPLRAEVRAELNIDDDAWVIGTVGRLAAEKNQALLLSAFGALDASRSLFLVVVGDGAERAALTALAEKLGISARVRFVGARNDAPRLLAAFDVFCLSSTTEGLPLVIPEAMATALPVVSTRVGGIATVVQDGVTGLLVPSGDRAALTTALATLAADPKRAQAMGAHARTLALTRYSAERMVDDYLKLYEPRGAL